MLSLNVTVIAGDCWYIEFYPELANFTTVSVVDRLIRQKRGDNVCVCVCVSGKQNKNCISPYFR